MIFSPTPLCCKHFITSAATGYAQLAMYFLNAAMAVLIHGKTAADGTRLLTAIPG